MELVFVTSCSSEGLTMTRLCAPRVSQLASHSLLVIDLPISKGLRRHWPCRNSGSAFYESPTVVVRCESTQYAVAFPFAECLIGSRFESSQIWRMGGSQNVLIRAVAAADPISDVVPNISCRLAMLHCRSPFAYNGCEWSMPGCRATSTLGDPFSTSPFSPHQQRSMGALFLSKQGRDNHQYCH
jgi:hypothetical protein